MEMSLGVYQGGEQVGESEGQKVLYAQLVTWGGHVDSVLAVASCILEAAVALEARNAKKLDLKE